MNWIDQQVSLYSTHADNIGTPRTIRQILLCDFARDMNIICSLRKMDKSDPEYDVNKKELKSRLQCFTPAALLKTKAKGQMTEIDRSGLMQLDFDYKDIWEYDIEELKLAVFDLPFICFCGVSCSGDGFYALAQIAEPYRLTEYAEHCFEVLDKYGIKADTSKGKKPENLRYVSYDCRMLIKDDPVPLKIKNFKPKKVYKQESNTVRSSSGKSEFINKALQQIANASVGSRWQTVQKLAYTLGGTTDKSILSEIKQTIKNSSNYSGLEDKYIQCAKVCFEAGALKPLK